MGKAGSAVYYPRGTSNDAHKYAGKIKYKSRY